MNRIFFFMICVYFLSRWLLVVLALCCAWYAEPSGRCESGSKSVQAIFKDAFKQLRCFAVAHALRDEGSRPFDETPTFSRLLTYAYRRQIVGDREWRLNDGVAVASSSVVEFLQPFDNGHAVRGGQMPNSASLGRLAP